MSWAPPGNGPCTDTHTHALDLLRDALGATVIATYPNGRGPASRHRALRAVRRDHDPLRPARLTPVRRLPAARPRRAVKRPGTPLRWCHIRSHLALRERVNRPKPTAGPDSEGSWTASIAKIPAFAPIFQ